MYVFNNETFIRLPDLFPTFVRCIMKRVHLYSLFLSHILTSIFPFLKK